LVARSSPAMMLRTVDLPQPEWPMMAMNSPFSTLRLMSCSAQKEPRFEVKVMPMDSRLR